MCFSSPRDQPGRFDDRSMTGPPRPSARQTWPAGDGHLRVSHAEREAVATALRQHATDGRLSLEEFEERLEQALEAVTYDQLRHVLRDLPRLTSDVPARTAPAWPRVPVLLVVLVIAVVVAAVATGGPFPAIPLAIWAFFIARRTVFARRNWVPPTS